MILSSKETLIVSASQSKQFFMFDPKTTAVLHKYREDAPILPHIVYSPHSQQILAQQVNKTFVSLWNWDAQQPQLKISLAETMTALTLTPDSHFLMGGSSTGNLYLWQLPSGILLRKRSLHASPLMHIIHYRNSHLITASKTEVKVWTLSALLIDQDNSPPLKQHNSLLDIVWAAQSRGIVALLTHKNLTLLSGSLTQQPREMKVHQKIDYEFATALAVSRNCAFVGDGKGCIDVVELIQNEDRQGSELYFKGDGQSLQISRNKKKRVLSGSKSPVTSLAFVQSLSYLVSGHVSGELIVWNNYEIKKSLHLFKTSIIGIAVLPKPIEQKVVQAAKIRPLHKYEQGKEQEPLEIVAGQGEWDSGVEGELEREGEEEEIVDRMMACLRRPQKLLREEISVLRGERSKLLQANLHYFKLLAP